MKTLGNILAFLLALAVLAFVIWGGYIGVRFLAGQFELIDSREMPVLIISSVVFLAGMAILANAIRSVLHKRDKQIHPDKAKVYTRIFNILSQPDPDFKMVKSQLNEWLPGMQLWAGDDVLKSFNRLIESLEHSDISHDKLTKKAASLMLEIRKDLGYKNRRISFSPFKTNNVKPN